MIEMRIDNVSENGDGTCKVEGRVDADEGTVYITVPRALYDEDGNLIAMAYAENDEEDDEWDDDPCNSCSNAEYCDGWEARFCCVRCIHDGCDDCENCDPMDI